MLIKSLCDYADLREKNEIEISKGWQNFEKIAFRINLKENGDIDSISDIREKKSITDKKGKEKIITENASVIIPERTQKTAIGSNTIEHRPLYIFGLDFNKKTGTFEETKKSKDSHVAFKKHELEFFEDLNSPVCVAYRKFIEKWNPEAETENEILKSISKDYSCYYSFGLVGGKYYLEEDTDFIEKYNKTINDLQLSDNKDKVMGTCSISGEYSEIARIHDKITFPGGNTSGCGLVAMKESAFESYGKTQSYNSGISVDTMKKYTSTLNMLLGSKSHQTRLSDMVVIYYAMKENDTRECDFFSSFFSDSYSAGDAENSLASVVNRFTGGVSSETSGMIDDDVTFYIVGMVPNSSRISQKFIYRENFGKIMENMIQHQNDLCIDEKNRKNIYFNRILKELISPNATDGKVPPPLITNLLLSAMNGTSYPNGLLETVIRRVKTDSDNENNHYIKLNDTRAGIIKACINRKLRNSGKKEEIHMSIDKESTNQAYLCGRLFAVYEKIQDEESGGNLNRTIKDSYFSSACSRPAVIMPKLDKLAQNHMRKLTDGRRIYFLNLIGEIMNGIAGEFPQTLDLDSQGRFIVGYYHQNKELYTKKQSD